MVRLRSYRLRRGLLAAPLLLALLVLGAGSASAAAPPKATPSPASVSQDAGRGSLPAGENACAPGAAKRSSGSASCQGSAGSAGAARAAETVSAPDGAAACRSTAGKHSSSAAACAESPSRATAAAAALSPAYSVSLAASPNALAPGGTTTLTATANRDVGPTPYYIEIFDQTTGAYLAACGFGSSCATSVTQGGSTIRDYVAFVSNFGTGYPPPGVQATSGTARVTWISVSLWASPSALAPGGTTTLTAAASLNVGPTPYWIEIFDATTGANVAYCGYGTSCSTSVTQSGSTVRTYVAYVSGFGLGYPPPNVRAVSNSVTVSWISVSLSAYPRYLWHGSGSTLTAAASLDVGPTPYWIEIYDRTTGAYLASCGSGTTCSTTVSQPSPTTHAYIAFVSSFGTGFPPPNVRATSNTVYVSWV